MPDLSEFDVGRTHEDSWLWMIHRPCGSDLLKVTAWHFDDLDDLIKRANKHICPED